VWLEVEGLHAHYGLSHVLHGVDFAVDRGEVVCLLGRNGVGKSTTLKAIMGLLRPSAGQVVFRGTRIEGLPAHRIARLGVGYVPEERRIFPTITVLENLVMGMKPPADGGVSAWTVETVCNAFPHLAERARQRAGTLSGGEQQMLTVARTLMGNPSLVLIDEPTEGLAPMIVEQVEQVLAEIHRQGTSVLLVEQSTETALALATRVYVMAKGQIVFGGSVEAFKADASIRRQYLEV